MMFEDFLELLEFFRKRPRLSFQRALELFQRHWGWRKDKAKDATIPADPDDPRECGSHGAVRERHSPVDRPLFGRCLHFEINYDLSAGCPHNCPSRGYGGKGVGPPRQLRWICDERQRLAPGNVQIDALHVEALHDGTPFG